MKAYRIVDRSNSQFLRESLTKNGQILLPMVELIEGSRMVINELIDVLGRARAEDVLELSARDVAAKKHTGRRQRAIRWHATAAGSVRLSDRKIRIRKPRLREEKRFGPRGRGSGLLGHPRQRRFMEGGRIYGPACHPNLQLRPGQLPKPRETFQPYTAPLSNNSVPMSEDDILVRRTNRGPYPQT